MPEQPTWIARTNRFWYRRSVRGGNEFVLVNAETRVKEAPFDHARLAAGISSAAGGKYTAVTLPFTTFTFVDNDRAIEFTLAPGGAGGGAGRGAPPGGPGGPPMWRCSLETYTCRPPAAAGRGGRGGRGGGGLAGPVRPVFDINGAEPKKSPDEKLEAVVNNYNVAIREAGKREVTLLSTDGSEGGYYDPDSLVWSPDSTKIAVYKVTPGFRRYVHFVESSPEDQLQPKDSTMQYAKPGDVVDVERPVIFDVATKKQIVVDTALFPNAYDVSRLEWRKRGAAVDVRVQPARSPDLPRHRDRRGHGTRARGRDRGAEDLLLLLRQEIPARPRATAWSSSGCPSATAGTISICTTASPGP